MSSITIALILSSSTLQKIQKGLAENIHPGIEFQIIDLYEKPEFIFTQITSSKIDGIISEFHPYLTETICSFGKPMIMINADILSDGVCTVLPDHYLAGELAAEHFHEKGYKNFAYIGFQSRFFEDELLEGFKDTLMAHSVQRFQFAKPAKYNSETMQPSLRKKIVDWIHALPKPSGILVHGQYLARHITRYCHHLNIPIPEDIGIISSNNDTLTCELITPKISAINFNFNIVGEISIDTLLEWVSTGTRPEFNEIKFPPDSLLIRESTDIKNSTDQRIIQAMEYINNHYMDGIDVNDILNKIPIHRRTLERKFKDLIGRSPKEEILRHRLNLATHLLKTSNHDIRSVSELSGFSSPEQMTQYLKKKTGKTAREIRKS